MKAETRFLAPAIREPLQTIKSRLVSWVFVLLCGLALCQTPVFASTVSVLNNEHSSACQEKRAAVLVGGVGEDWRYFSSWVPFKVARRSHLRQRSDVVPVTSRVKSTRGDGHSFRPTLDSRLEQPFFAIVQRHAGCELQRVFQLDVAMLDQG